MIFEYSISRFNYRISIRLCDYFLKVYQGKLPVALLSSVACELAPLRIVLLCVFLYLFFIFLLLF